MKKKNSRPNKSVAKTSQEKKTIKKKYNLPLIVIITVFLGILFGILLINTNIANNKDIVFQYIQFMLTACILALLIDIRSTLKSKP